MNYIRFLNKDILTKLLLATILISNFSLSGCNKKTEDSIVASKIKINKTKEVLEEDQIERPSFREDFLKAKKQNSDTVAWINIPGTNINFPVVQDLKNRSSGDEDYYVHRDFNGNKVAVGKESAIMSDRANTISPFEKLSNNVIISGHNVNLNDDPNGKMFAPLGNFKNLEFSKKTPYIFLTTEDKELVYEVFASYYSEERFGSYLPKKSEKEMSAMIKEAKERSNFIYDDVEVDGKDKVLTLYTCTYHFGPYKSLAYYRVKYIVQARLLSDNEKLKETTNVRLNPNPKQVYYSYCARCNKEMTVKKCTENAGLCDNCKTKK